MWILIITLLLAVILMSLKILPPELQQENYVPYKIKPFDYLSTGSDPLYFYQLKQFRLPYKYPQTFYKSYPAEHQSYFEMSNMP